MKTWILAGAFLALSLALAYFVAPHASESPDGLEKVAEDKGFLEKGEGDPAWKKSPAPDYKFPGVGDEKRATSLAGIAGVAGVFVLGCGVAWVLTRRRAAPK
ncbi:MAG: PDGLE domain-containing protein [Planctomycetia bacterium]|nr:PDGLE domain-containing protein [Planctomycetia bacterium]